MSQMKVWDGASHIEPSSVKYWNGSSWVEAMPKRWTGSVWEELMSYISPLYNSASAGLRKLDPLTGNVEWTKNLSSALFLEADANKTGVWYCDDYQGYKFQPADGGTPSLRYAGSSSYTINVYTVSHNPDHFYMGYYNGSTSYMVRRRDWVTGSLVFSADVSNPPSSMLEARGGVKVFVGYNGYIQCLDTSLPAGDSELWVNSMHTGDANALIDSPDGTYLYFVAWDGTLYRHNASTGAFTGWAFDSTEQLKDLAISPDGAYVYTTGYDNYARQHIVASSSVGWATNIGNDGRAIVISDDGQFVYTVHSGGYLNQLYTSDGSKGWVDSQAGSNLAM